MILITGGAGFIGSHLADRLRKESEVRVLDNLSAGDQNVAYLRLKGIQIVRGDIRNAKTVHEAVKDVTVVFHLAAMNRAARSIEHPLEANAVNIDGTLNVLDACRKEGCDFIFASSSSVYGGTGGKEDQALCPLHPYGVGKLAGEHYARVYHQLYGVPSVILRYVSVYGPRQRGDIDHAAVIPKFIGQVQNGKPVTVFGSGDQTRQFTYVEDTVEGTLLAWKKSRTGDAFNIASSEETSVNQILKGIEKMTGKKAYREVRPQPLADPNRNVIDVSKSKKRLGFSAATPFQEGLKKTFDWTVSQGTSERH